MNAEELVSKSIVGTDFVTVFFGGKPFTIYPPSIKIICRAIADICKIEVGESKSTLDALSYLPQNKKYIIRVMSAFVVGDKKNWRWAAFKVGKQVDKSTNKEIIEAWNKIIPLLGGQDFFDYATSMKSVQKMVAKAK